MILFSDFEQFLQSHRQHGEVSWYTGQATPAGYEVRLACPSLGPGVALVTCFPDTVDPRGPEGK